jgi:putative phosphoribosyl transferase
MMSELIEKIELRDREAVFADRREAGEMLADLLPGYRGCDAIILAIPSGGVPVGLVVADRLGLPIDLLVIRKIPIPGNTEAGFGALTLEGDLLLNDFLLAQLDLTPGEIERLAVPVRAELRARNKLFREDRPFPDLARRRVLLVDDGLASGYTMLAAVGLVRRHGAAETIIAVPTAARRTVERLSPEVDLIVCPNIRSGRTFAVAAAYRTWHDLSSTEVLELLQQHGLITGQ